MKKQRVDDIDRHEDQEEQEAVLDVIAASRTDHPAARSSALLSVITPHLQNIVDVSRIIVSYVSSVVVLSAGALGDDQMIWRFDVKSRTWFSLPDHDDIEHGSIIGVCTRPSTGQAYVVCDTAVFLYSQQRPSFQLQWKVSNLHDSHDPGPPATPLWYQDRLYVVRPSGWVYVAEMDDAQQSMTWRHHSESSCHSDIAPSLVTLNEKDVFWCGGLTQQKSSGQAVHNVSRLFVESAAHAPDGADATLAPHMVQCGGYVAAATCNGTLYVCGGRSDWTLIAGRIAAMECWRPGQSTWTALAKPDMPRCCGNLIDIGHNQLLLLAGHSDNDRTDLPVEIYDISSDTWTRSHSMPIARWRGSACVYSEW